MRIEKHYWHDYMKRNMKIEEELLKEAAAASDLDRAAQKAQLKNEAKKIIETAERVENATRYLENENSIRIFTEIYENMMIFAKQMECDIVIESDLEKSGKISLSFDYLLIDGNIRFIMMQYLTDMLSKAHSTIISVIDSMIRMECQFNLAEKLIMKPLL